MHPSQIALSRLFLRFRPKRQDAPINYEIFQEILRSKPGLRMTVRKRGEARLSFFPQLARLSGSDTCNSSYSQIPVRGMKPSAF